MVRIERLSNDVTLYQGDCREILPTLGKFDAVVTDPPYGINFLYEGYDDTRENLTHLIKSFLPTCLNSANRTIILCGPTQISLYLEPNWVGAICWNTTGSFGKYGFNQWTPILLYGEDIKGFGSINGVVKSDLIFFSGQSSIRRDAIEKEHPCPKSIFIMIRVLARFTEEKSLVCDPFMGSGTTGVAAVKMGRQFTGIELEPKYFDIACRRISEAMKQPDLFIEQPKTATKQEAMI